MVQPSSIRQVAPVVSTKWLEESLNVLSRSCHVLEVAWMKDEHENYQRSRIPSAQPYVLSKCVTPTQFIPRGLPDLSCWQEYIRMLGVRRDSHVVFYDRHNNMWAARAWWTFRLFGHHKVSVLNGGWKNWTMDELPEETGDPTSVMKSDFTAKSHNSKLIKSYEDMVQISKDKSFQIIDARREEYFLGQAEEPNEASRKALSVMGQTIPPTLHRGHIPGSFNLYKNHLLNPQTNCLLEKDELEKVFSEHEIYLDDRCVTLCVSGVSACLLALAAAHLGTNHMAVYLGSWTEYGQRASADDVSQQPANFPSPTDSGG